MSETEIQNNIKAALNKLPGVICYRNSVFAGRMPSGYYASAGLGKGSADLICCVNGTFLALEVKVPGKKAEEHQKAWGQALTDRGGVYKVVSSVTEAVAVVRETQHAGRTSGVPTKSGQAD